MQRACALAPPAAATAPGSLVNPVRDRVLGRRAGRRLAPSPSRRHRPPSARPPQRRGHPRPCSSPPSPCPATCSRPSSRPPRWRTGRTKTWMTLSRTQAGAAAAAQLCASQPGLLGAFWVQASPLPEKGGGGGAAVVGQACAVTRSRWPTCKQVPCTRSPRTRMPALASAHEQGAPSGKRGAAPGAPGAEAQQVCARALARSPVPVRSPHAWVASCVLAIPSLGPQRSPKRAHTCRAHRPQDPPPPPRHHHHPAA